MTLLSTTARLLKRWRARRVGDPPPAEAVPSDLPAPVTADAVPATPPGDPRADLPLPLLPRVIHVLGQTIILKENFKPDAIVVVGNCLAETVAKGLRSLKGTHHDFDVAAWRLHLQPDPSAEVLEHLNRAEHVLVQNISQHHAAKIADLLRPGCKMSLLPNVSMLALWPFDSIHYRPDPVAEKDKNGLIQHGDGLLAQLRESTPNKEERFEIYRTLRVPGLVIKRRMEIQIEQLLESDASIGCTIGKFIVDNYQNRQLFYNCTHPGAEVYQRFCELSYELLGLPGSCPMIAGLDVWRHASVPVHPVVAKRLGVTWATRETLYDYGGLGMVTWAQFVKAYIDRFG